MTTTPQSVPPGTVAMADVTPAELGLATRNHGFLLEALRYPVTPVGLHYLLIHYDIPAIDAATWSLHLGGLVRRPMRLTLEDIRARPAVTRRIVFECAGNGRMSLQPRALSQPWGVEAVGNAEWTGTPLRPLLEEAGLDDAALEVVFTGLDSGVENGEPQRYERSLAVAEAMRDEVLLVYEINGQPLTPQHGYPLRLVVPGWYGMTNVKWLSQITVVDEPFNGYQQARAYRWRTEPDDPGEPLSRMRPRALMLPPGVPDFFTRQRIVPPGPVTIQGRAWSGFGPIERVEVSFDGGETWADAALEPQPDRYTWVGWSTEWTAVPGEHRLLCRATDNAGNVQPDEPVWNLGGYACNTPHEVVVLVNDV